MAANRGNNLNGTSRDHIFSIKEGFIQGINPEIISHPANCELVRQIENSLKNSKCGITLEALLERINEFEERFRGRTLRHQSAKLANRVGLSAESPPCLPFAIVL